MSNQPTPSQLALPPQGRPRLLRGFRQLVLAETCIGCGRPVTSEPAPASPIADADGAGYPGDQRLCLLCRDQLAALASAPYCPACGHGMAPVGSCAVCATERPPAGTVVRIGPYDGLLAEMIRSLKFRDSSYLVRPLAARMLRALGGRNLGSFDLAAAIPLHWWHYWQRGYNQAHLLLRELQRLGLKVPQRRVLRKIRHTRPQVGLSGEARRRNVRGAFAIINPRAVQGRRILLVDDVLTTGATAGACVRELKQAGAAEVVVLVAAVAGINHEA